MKFFLITLLTLRLCQGGETGLTVVYQPLNGFGSGEITILPVACQDFYSHSGMTRPGFVTRRNLAPSTAPGGPTDINLASVVGITMSHDIPEPGKDFLLIDCSKAKADAEGYGIAKIFRASLEALRLTVPDMISKAELKFTIPEGMPELRRIADEFEKHDKSKPFPQPTE